MLNWIKFLSVFLFTLFVTIAIIVFYQAEKPFASTREAAMEAAVKDGELEKAERAEIYHGSTAVVSVFGTDEEGKERIILMNEETGDIIRTVNPGNGITKQEAADLVKKEGGVEKILHTILGIEKDTLFWEVTYQGEDDSLNYVYLHFKDGRWWKRIMRL